MRARSAAIRLLAGTLAAVPSAPWGQASGQTELPQISVSKPKPAAVRRAPRPIRRPAPATATTAPAGIGGTAPTDTAAGTGRAPPVAASEITVTGEQVNAIPVTRPGEIVEVAPGLIATQHSGEGKANQYFLRGYNLDHGTDLAITVDGMPINMRTHGHGQGYADLNFLIPELISFVLVRKGPYNADVGDFANAGALDIGLLRALEKNVAQLTVGSFGYRRLLGMASTKIDDGVLLVAAEAGTYNGPWVDPDDMRKLNGLVRYSQGTADNGLSLTGMAYTNKWNSTDQVPERAISSGLLGLYQAFDPSDGGNAERYSLSGQWAQSDAAGASRANFYAIKSNLDLYNNFTYFLTDQTNGDQFHQHDARTVYGFNAAHTVKDTIGALPVATTFGLQTRYDDIDVGLTDTVRRQFLSNVRTDLVKEGSVAIYGESSVRWTDWLRTVVGWRGDVYWASVNSIFDPANSGNVSALLGSPKFSLVLGPFAKTEFFFNYGSGFHSNDARGSTITESPTDPATKLSASPLLIPTHGAELGIRSKIIDGLTSSLSLWTLEQASEIIFQGDAGDTVASRPSQRVGVEWTNDYRPLSWVDFETVVAVSRARFVGFDSAQAETYLSLAGYPQAQIGNAPGNYVPNAPGVIASATLTLGKQTGWFGALKWRYLGPRPLTEDGGFWSPATGLINARVGYRFENGWRVQLDAFNITNSHSDQITYAYGSFLKTDSLYALCFPTMGASSVPAAVCQNGVMDRVLHPVEPLAIRLTLAGVI